MTALAQTTTIDTYAQHHVCGTLAFTVRYLVKVNGVALIHVENGEDAHNQRVHGQFRDRQKLVRTAARATHTTHTRASQDKAV